MTQVSQQPPSIAVCIPAYSRVQEYCTLLESIVQLEVLPKEVVVCEDASQERDQLRKLSRPYADQLALRQCNFVFHENEKNLGYDANLREIFKTATADYVFFIGNDDYILPQAIVIAQDYLSQHPVLAASRTFLRFEIDPKNPVGISRCFDRAMMLNRTNSTAGTMLRIGGFFGGLMFQRRWAISQTTARYDGSLFYQIYLLLMAFGQGDVGYINTPTVAARAGNSPLFGTASSEKEHFTPGRYTARARGKMWESIMWIAKECEEKNQIPMLASIKYELTTRMSFHVFEMFVGRSRQELEDLKSELQRIGLFDHAIPKTLYAINHLFGSHAKYIYLVARRLFQR